MTYSADCDPSECTTLTFDITVDDQCDDYRNETLVLGFSSLSTGLCAGDADGGVVDGVTYSETFDTFTLDIWNDEGTYCFKKIETQVGFRKYVY